jgi:hypothetical protein
VTYANRADLSVNGALVEGFRTTGAILRTQTNLNVAGGFAGGGVGNKCILGNWGYDNFALSALLSCRFRFLDLTPQIVMIAGNNGYFNTIVELDPVGAPGVFAIFSFCTDNPPVNVGVVTTPALNTRQIDWSTPANFVGVVLDKGMVTAGGPIVVQSAGPANFPLNTANWSSRGYSIPSILVAYPNARLRNALPVDGGMPFNSVVPAILLVLGDSGNRVLAQRLLQSWQLNGVEI